MCCQTVTEFSLEQYLNVRIMYDDELLSESITFLGETGKLLVQNGGQ